MQLQTGRRGTGTTTAEETVSVTASKTLSSLSKSQGARSR